MRVRIRYTGRVQGVGFRATAHAIAAADRTVSGWVRNEHDGSVLMELQGESAAIDRILETIRTRMSRNIRHEDRSAIVDALDERGFVIQR